MVQAITPVLSQASKCPQLLVAGEAINAIVDVFADDDKDALFRRAGLLKTLRAAVRPFQQMVRKSKSSEIPCCADIV